MARSWWGQLDQPSGGPQEAAILIFAVTMDMHAGCAAAGRAGLPEMAGSAAKVVVVGERSSLGRWDCAETSRLHCGRRYSDWALESVVAVVS